MAILQQLLGTKATLGTSVNIANHFADQEMKAALKTLFKPDKMNYAALSNTSSVIHVHIIPRYKDSREFAGVIFKDTRWGSNYAPYDKSYVTDESVLFQIRDVILDAL